MWSITAIRRLTISMLTFGMVFLLASCKKNNDDAPPSKANPNEIGDQPIQGRDVDIIVGTAGRKQFEGSQPGDIVKVRCEFSNIESSVIAFHQGMRYAGNRRSISAPELVRESAKEAQAFEQTYRNQRIVIEGVLVRLDEFRVTLSGSKAVGVGKHSIWKARSKFAAGKADYIVSTDEFLMEMKKNAKNAKSKYQGKIIDLTGVIHSVSQGPLDMGTVFFFNKSNQYVLCRFTSNDESWRV